MTFQEDKKEEFLNLFKNAMKHIRYFPGCLHLELLQDINSAGIYYKYTYSYWEDEEALEQ